MQNRREKGMQVSVWGEINIQRAGVRMLPAYHNNLKFIKVIIKANKRHIF
jgi:hypothetical protein